MFKLNNRRELQNIAIDHSADIDYKDFMKIHRDCTKEHFNFLCRRNAKISALSSGKLDKYEYLTGADLGYRPDPVQKVKLEYSPLGQVFNKGLTTDEKSEGLLKRLKNIEDKTDNQLIAIENNVGNQPAIKDGINNQPPPIKDRKISDKKY